MHNLVALNMKEVTIMNEQINIFPHGAVTTQDHLIDEAKVRKSRVLILSKPYLRSQLLKKENKTTESISYLILNTRTVLKDKGVLIKELYPPSMSSVKFIF